MLTIVRVAAFSAYFVLLSGARLLCIADARAQCAAADLCAGVALEPEFGLVTEFAPFGSLSDVLHWIPTHEASSSSRSGHSIYDELDLVRCIPKCSAPFDDVLLFL